MQSPQQTSISAESPGTFVYVAGHVLHPNLYEIEPSAIQQFTGKLTIKDHRGLPERVRELCNAWIVSPADTPQLWFDVWLAQPLPLLNAAGKPQMVPVWVRMNITDFVWAGAAKPAAEAKEPAAAEA